MFPENLRETHQVVYRQRGVAEFAGNLPARRNCRDGRGEFDCCIGSNDCAWEWLGAVVTITQRRAGRNGKPVAGFLSGGIRTSAASDQTRAKSQLRVRVRGLIVGHLTGTEHRRPLIGLRV